MSAVNSNLAKIAEIAGPQRPDKLPRSVQATASNIENHFASTAQALRDTAKRMRARADNLDEKAAYLEQMIGIAQDIRTAVATEQQYFEEVKSLALVGVKDRQAID